MGTALDKVLRAAGQEPAPVFVPDAGSLLIRAAGDLLDELALLLAKGDDDSDSKKDAKGKAGDDDDEDEDDDLPPWLKKKKGKSDSKSKKSVKAAGLVDAARLALSGLAVDWSAGWPELAAAKAQILTASGDVTSDTTMVKLAGQTGMMFPLQHGPFVGSHSHPHHKTVAHDHEHTHNGDSHHMHGKAVPGRPAAFSAPAPDWAQARAAFAQSHGAPGTGPGQPMAPNSPDHHQPMTGVHSHSHAHSGDGHSMTGWSGQH